MKFILIFIVYSFIQKIRATKSTQITTRNVSFNGKIVVKEVKEAHNLFIGRCVKNEPVLHEENVVLNNDGLSQVSANIRINVEGPVRITCVKIFDENPDVSAYPEYVSGGIGYNYVEFNVLTTFGTGFKFFVQVFGLPKFE